MARRVKASRPDAGDGPAIPPHSRPDFQLDLTTADFVKAAGKNLDKHNLAIVVANVGSFAIEWREVENDEQLQKTWDRKPVKNTKGKVWHIKVGIHCRVIYCVSIIPSPRLIFFDALQREGAMREFDQIKARPNVRSCCGY